MVINWVQGYWSSRSFQSYLNYLPGYTMS